MYTDIYGGNIAMICSVSFLFLHVGSYRFMVQQEIITSNVPRWTYTIWLLGYESCLTTFDDQTRPWFKGCIYVVKRHTQNFTVAWSLSVLGGCARFSWFPDKPWQNHITANILDTPAKESCPMSSMFCSLIYGNRLKQNSVAILKVSNH